MGANNTFKNKAGGWNHSGRVLLFYSIQIMERPVFLERVLIKMMDIPGKMSSCTNVLD